MVAAERGLAEAGAIRAADLLLAPALTGVMALRTASLAPLSRLAHRGGHVLRACLLLGLVLTAGTATWGVLVYVSPWSIGERLVGDSWVGATTVLGVMIVFRAVGAASVPAGTGLLVVGRENLVASIQVLTGIALVALMWPVASSGIVQACWLLAVTEFVGAVLMWGSLGRFVHRSRSQEGFV